LAFHEFRHLHRTLLSDESLPRLPTLLEQLEVLRSAPLAPVTAAHESVPEREEGDDEDWPESS